MKSFLIIPFIPFVFSLSNGQSYSWSHSWGSTDTDFSTHVASDAQSNVYVAGVYRGAIDFDPGPGDNTLTSGGSGIALASYISKLDSSGQYLWTRQLTSDSYSGANDVVYDSKGYIYIVGSFTGTSDFDPGPNAFNLTTLNNSYDAYILKLDLNGNFIWAINIGLEGTELGNTIALDTNGNVVIGGIFGGTTDLDPGPNQTLFTANGMTDLYAAKYTSEGNMIWGRQFAGTIQAAARGIDIDTKGNIYLTGFFDDRRDFDPGPDTMYAESMGLWDAYVIKLNAAGNFKWVRILGNENSNWANAVAVDDEGNVHVTGYFTDALDFKPGPDSLILTAINFDAFVWKLDTTGQLIWVAQLGGISNDQGTAITIDRNGGVYTTGYYAETIDFDPGTTAYNLTSTGNNDLNDVFVSKLNADGSFAWARTLGGAENDFGGEIILGPVDEIYLAGTYQGTGGFSPGTVLSDSLISEGLADVFLARWRQCLESYGEISVFSCGYFLSPSGLYVWNESGTYLDTIQNKAGCDSIITFHLTISDLGLVVTQQGNTLIGSGGAGNFYWLDCDHDFSIVGQGEEYTPTANGNYALTGSGIICSDTSACFAFIMTATKEIYPSFAISVYPNPAKNSLSIDLHRSYTDIDVVLISQVGMKMYTNHYAQEELISIEMELPAGVYFVTITSSEKTFLKKLIVQ